MYALDRFSILRSQNVRTKVLGTTGKEVTVLVNEILEAGVNEVNFTA